MASVLEPATALIDQHTPKTKVNRSGYHLDGVLHDRTLDLARLIVGSEGTLALITEATVRTEPLPNAWVAVLLFFDRLESAARGALEIAGMEAAACDLMDRRLLSIARDADVRYDLFIPRDAEADAAGGDAGRDAGRSPAADAERGGAHPAPQTAGV